MLLYDSFMTRKEREFFLSIIKEFDESDDRIDILERLLFQIRKMLRDL